MFFFTFSGKRVDVTEYSKYLIHVAKIRQQSVLPVYLCYSLHHTHNLLFVHNGSQHSMQMCSG